MEVHYDELEQKLLINKQPGGSIFLNILKIPAQLFLLTFLLSACGSTNETPSGEATLAAIYTSAAKTVSAQIANSTSTPTPLPISTPIPQATATIIPTKTANLIPTTAPIVNTNISSCDASVFITDVTIPDGTVLAPGESFTKTWDIQNTGTCTWTTSYSIAYTSGSALGGSTTALGSSVSPGGTGYVSVAMVAPSTTGTYTGYWKLQNASGVLFGSSVYVQIVVSDDAATVTPTPTATDDESAYTATPTTAPTATTEPTSTTAPTSTQVPTSPPDSGSGSTETPTS